ncbi:Glycosyltransferase involved in cell wall bisynthesis [Prauserella aidingensis]|nr:Glycosyltransferase involved in cell wall bisynthesis [Prauserella aidingensis]
MPVVQTFHALGSVKRRFQGSADTSPAERVKIEKSIGHAVDRVLATRSDEVFELVRLGVPRERISIVPCGVDVERFSPRGARAGPERTRKHRLVAVGRLVPRKGFATAIEALAELPDTELVVAGGPKDVALADDPEARRLREAAEAAGVADRVRLIGQVSRSDMPGLLRSADMVLCTPWYEPFGMVPLEAVACGVPVVASAVGGLTDTVVEGTTGGLAPPRDPRGLADAVGPLLADESVRESCGMAGRNRAVTRYSWHRVAHDCVRAYQRVAPGARTPTAVATSQ